MPLKPVKNWKQVKDLYVVKEEKAVFDTVCRK